ncbi:MAG TPA: fatty acid desaturase [Trichocoleus sp.]
MATSTTPPSTLSHDLRIAVADLEQVNPWVGLWRFASVGILFLITVVLAWSTSNLILFIGLSAIASMIYAFWLICTHDMLHHTLTGWKWFDEGMARLISYPMLWPYGTYAQLHRLHHAWNGIDLRDPERVQWTQAEYEQANSWQQWYVRHQWSINILGLGGFGLIAKTVYNGLRFRHQVPALYQTLLTDGLGIFVAQASLITLAIQHNQLTHYLLFCLILERVIGAITQLRDHIEHYALWNTHKGHQLTQLYACRNLNTPAFVSWLMCGLDDHSMHHAFPNIPFNHLAEAFHRTQAVLEQHQLPVIPRGDGYIRETLRLSTQPQLIEMSVGDPS